MTQRPALSGSVRWRIPAKPCTTACTDVDPRMALPRRLLDFWRGGDIAVFRTARFGRHRYSDSFARANGYNTIRYRPGPINQRSCEA